MTESLQYDRRKSDALFSRGFKIAGGVGTFVLVLLTLAFKLYSQMQDFPQVKDRVTALEVARQADHEQAAVQLMMTCVLYQDAHPATVPTLCDQAIRRTR